MSKPTLSDFNPKYQAQISAQLHATPRPRTVKIALADADDAPEGKRCSPDMAATFYAAGIQAPEREYRFHDKRRWRFDYAWVQARVALEVEGGVWTGGRHTSGAGFMKDIEKYNRATLLGWRVFRCVPSTLKSKETLAMIRLALA